MIALKTQKIFLIFLLACFAPLGAFSQQAPRPSQKPKQTVQRYTLPPNPRERFRFSNNQSAKNSAALQAYRKRVIAQKKQTEQRLKAQRYRQYLERYNELQNRAKSSRKSQKKKAFSRPKQKTIQETLQQNPRQRRLLRNKKILEGLEAPDAQDSPYYVQFIDDINRLTFGKE